MTYANSERAQLSSDRDYDDGVFGLRKPQPTASALGARTTARLADFADLIAGVDSSSLPAYAVELEPDRSLRAALERANLELRVDSRRSAVQVEVDRFLDVARRGLGRRTDVKTRVEVARGLERAVASLVLWDHLDSETRMLLAGPWADLVEVAVNGIEGSPGDAEVR